MATQTNEQQIGVLKRLCLRQRAAAWLLGASPRSLRDQGAPRRADGTYSVRSLVEWALERGRAQTDADPLLSGGGNSPWLEAYRREKAREAKRKNDTEEGQLVLAADVEVAFRETGLALRQEFEALERAHGAAVGEAIRQAIDRAEALWESRLPATCGKGRAK